MKVKRQNRPHHEGAFVLLAVLVFILLLSMIALTLMFRAQSDESAASATAGSEQAWSAALSGVTEAMQVAAAAPPGSTDWQDDPATFRGRPVYQDGADQWSFTVFSPAASDSLAANQFGFSDEASRLNLNHPGDADLTKLPNVSATLAAALRRFTGQGNSSSPTNSPALTPIPPPADPSSDDPGVAFTDLSQIGLPSQVPWHGNLDTLDELLLMPGMSRSLLHGAPASPDFQVASTTATNGPQLPPVDNASKASRGLDQYFCVFSRDYNRSNAGQARCNLNDPNDPLPSVDLPAGFTNYVAALRAAKIQLQSVSDALEATTPATNENGSVVEISSGITKENLPLLLDLFATDKETSYDGLINVNTASAAVLATLPGIDQALADSIVSTRTGLDPERRSTIAWLYQEGVVDADKFKAIAPRLTARGFQYRFDVIGYGLPSGRYRVLEVVVDVGGTGPRVIYLRDITRLGLPIDLREKNIADPDSTSVSLRTPGSSSARNNHG